MKNAMYQLRLPCLIALVGSAVTSASAGLVFTLENPGIQQSPVAGVVTEGFDDGDLISAVGTYQGGSVLQAGVFGGAGGVGNYLLASANNASTLTFTTPQSYFGFWWSAGDAANSLQLYSQNNSLLGSYVVGDIIPLLSAAYYGNPNGIQGNSGEPYAYLNFTATGEDYIGKVVFGGSNFESDNHSVTTERITPPGKPPGNDVPDAGGSLGLLALGLSCLLVGRRPTPGNRQNSR